MNPWEQEPDHVDFKSAGFPCLLHRNAFGAWCGYVGLPPGHPVHGHGYDSPPLAAIEVHGGLTYAAPCQESGPICHKPDPGEADNVWWLGFDCNHCYDLAPYPWSVDHMKEYEAYRESMPWHLVEHQTYRTMAFARAETENLAYQLSRLAAAGKTC